MDKFSGYRFIASRIPMVVFWILGILTGLYVTITPPASYLSLMQGLEIQPLSIVSRFAVLFFFLVISVVFTFYNNNILLVVIVFCKAFLLAYAWRWFGIAFRDAGWLVCFLLMFFDICTVPVLFYFWLRCFAGDMQVQTRSIIYLAVYGLIIFCIDMYWVSPFVLSLFYHL